MTRPANTRTNSQGRVILKSSRPSPLKLSKGSHAHKSSSPRHKTFDKRDSITETDDDNYDVMAALPSFCATCEKQIINPNATFLYCSEACRRKDGSRSVSTALESGVPSPPVPDPDLDSEPFADIVPQQSPTVLRPASIISIDSEDESSASDRKESDAAKYLSQFLMSGSASPSRYARPSYRRNPTTTSHTGPPSLSHTPTSIASPFSSWNSMARTAPSKTTSWGHRPTNSRSFDFAVPASMGKTDVLQSKVSTDTAFRVAGGDLTYEKRPMAPTPVNSPCTGSLKQLFAHEAMRRSSSQISGTSLANLLAKEESR
ncbi:hypothetical protein K461DRAFT_295931 [Myriangium duriaei CBS 260.36]|uniref:Life-span regulatory factor domain-containing protein n=1 Tax=Myriangium duriaei CBS 260.36 TaxID=1168546 RepID=A0A9P4J1G9_9PEZI|nr:hypothetical protein K461DRAFT_295931 [Myriangium duriaei CBS 260.36]